MERLHPAEGVPRRLSYGCLHHGWSRRSRGEHPDRAPGRLGTAGLHGHSGVVARGDGTATARLTERGLLAGDGLSEDSRRLRDEIEGGHRAAGRARAGGDRVRSERGDHPLHGVVETDPRSWLVPTGRLQAGLGLVRAAVMVPRSGISTVRAANSSSAVGRHVASVRRVLAGCPKAISTVGGG